VQLGVADLLETLARREQRRLVHHVREVGAREARRAPCYHVEVDGVGEWLAFRVHLQNAFASAEIRTVDDDLTVEASGTKQRRVENVRTVRRRDEHDTGLRVEAVHLHEHLVERLLALVVAAAESGAAVTPDRVDLVDEY